MARRPIFVPIPWFAVLGRRDDPLTRVAYVEAVTAFARQYDLQCNACHTRPSRLNRLGDFWNRHEVRTVVIPAPPPMTPERVARGCQVYIRTPNA